MINELQNSVTAFTRDPERGGLTALQTISTLPADQKPLPNYSTAEVLVHPSGRFLYGSNRGHDSIAVFSIDEKSGRLTFVETQPTQGSTPRGFGIDPTGAYLLAGNQRSDSVVVFRINQETGRLTPTGSQDRRRRPGQRQVRRRAVRGYQLTAHEIRSQTPWNDGCERPRRSSSALRSS